MSTYDKLQKLLTIKKENLKTEEDIKKYQMINELLSDKSLFFQIPIETAVGILDFLDVPEDNILDFYFDIVSVKNYNDNMPKQRNIFPDNVTLQK